VLNVHRQPQWIDSTAWLAPTATVLGEVHIGARSSIWFGAVIRGDVEAIRIGDETNIQDLACLHADPGKPCVVGNRVTMGHQAIVHGATVEDECLIGIGAIVLNDARIGRHSIIGAGALVPEGKVIPPRSLVLGMPGKIVREITEQDLQRILHGYAHYVAAAARYREAGV
jgi:carbonic anhydrase/acetyltransferase-like protein (isoleucine patch superfamily)